VGHEKLEMVRKHRTVGISSIHIHYEYLKLKCFSQCIDKLNYSRIQTLRGHTDQVYNVEWAPHNESVLASCSSDRRVGIWDLSRIGMEQTQEDAEDGPPELLFLHGGHTSKVSDLSFNRNDEWTIASVSEDNVFQIWNMAEEIYADEEDEKLGEEGEDDDVLGDDELE